MSGIEGDSKTIAKAVDNEWRKANQKEDFEIGTVPIHMLPKHLRICQQVGVSPQTIRRWLENASVTSTGGIDGDSKTIAKAIAKEREDLNRRGISDIATVAIIKLPKHLRICQQVGVPPRTIRRWLENASVTSTGGIEDDSKTIANNIQQEWNKAHERKDFDLGTVPNHMLPKHLRICQQTNIHI